MKESNPIETNIPKLEEGSQLKSNNIKEETSAGPKDSNTIKPVNISMGNTMTFDKDEHEEKAVSFPSASEMTKADKI